MTVSLNNQILSVIPVPLDAKRTNYYAAGNSIVIETIAQYLLRVIEDVRDVYPVSVLLPKTGYISLGVYPITDFSTILTNFNIELYIFRDGLGDANFTPIIGNTAKQTGVNGGYFGEESVTDDYIYRCVTGGVAGVAIWKKIVLFQT